LVFSNTPPDVGTKYDAGSGPSSTYGQQKIAGAKPNRESFRHRYMVGSDFLQLNATCFHNCASHYSVVSTSKPDHVGSSVLQHGSSQPGRRLVETVPQRRRPKRDYLKQASLTRCHLESATSKILLCGLEMDTTWTVH
jgi:hypothetical protein